MVDSVFLNTMYELVFMFECPVIGLEFFLVLYFCDGKSRRQVTIFPENDPTVWSCIFHITKIFQVELHGAL